MEIHSGTSHSRAASKERYYVVNHRRTGAEEADEDGRLQRLREGGDVVPEKFLWFLILSPYSRSSSTILDDERPPPSRTTTYMFYHGPWPPVPPRGPTPCSDRLNTAQASVVGACLGGGRAKFECIQCGLGGLDDSPEGRTGGGGGMGRAMRPGGARGPFCVFVFVQGEASL